MSFGGSQESHDTASANSDGSETEKMDIDEISSDSSESTDAEPMEVDEEVEEVDEVGIGANEIRLEVGPNGEILVLDNDNREIQDLVLTREL